MRPADATYGVLVASGNLGYSGSYTRPTDVSFNAGKTVDDGGTSVRWSLREDPSTGVGTICIYPTDNDWGYMRPFSSSTDRAPWDVYTPYSDKFSQIVILNRVSASGDLGSMFFGCSKLESVDLTRLEMTSATRDVSHMFENCSSLTTVTNKVAPTYTYSNDRAAELGQADLSGKAYDASVDVRLPFKGVYLPAATYGSTGQYAFTPTITDSMFEGCTSLTNVVLSGFAEAATSMTRFLANAFDTVLGGVLSMSDVATGSVAPDLSELAAGAAISVLRMRRVGTGTNANFSHAFENVSSLYDASLTDVATGDGANLEYAFANTSTKMVPIVDNSAVASTYAALTGDVLYRAGTDDDGAQILAIDLVNTGNTGAYLASACFSME